MPIFDIETVPSVGLVGSSPQIIRINTSDPTSEVLSPGYLNRFQSGQLMGQFYFSGNSASFGNSSTNVPASPQMALVGTGDSGAQWLQVQVSGGGVISLVREAAFNDLGGILDSNGKNMLLFETAANAVNYSILSDAESGSSPSLVAAGDDENIAYLFSGKGTSGASIASNSGANNIALFSGVSASTTWLTFTSSTTGTAPIIGTGGETNVGLKLTSTGLQNIDFYSHGTASHLASFVGVASSINFLQVVPGATGDPVYIGAGGETNAGLKMSSRGTGNVNFYSGGGTLPIISLIGNVATPTNYLTFSPGASGSSVIISALGETNVDIALSPPGTGRVKFGSANSFTSSGAVTATLGTSAPTGASTTPAKWLTFIDNAGGKFVVPGFSIP